MGASWRSLGSVALLLCLAVPLSPLVHAGTASDPEVSDPAGDQAIDTGTVPIVPGVNDQSFDDVDVTAAYVSEFEGLTRITVVTTAGWGAGSMALDFSVAKGPTSLPSSTAHGTFHLVVNGTTTSGVGNATAASTADGLRIDMPTKGLGAVGGDTLTLLAINTTRTDPGNLQGVTQDDQTGTDTAGPGKAYTFQRPPPHGVIDVQLVRFANGTAASATLDDPLTLAYRLRVTNEGLDPDRVDVQVAVRPTWPSQSGVAQGLPQNGLDPGSSREVNGTLDVAAAPAGTYHVWFNATSTLGGKATATATFTIQRAQPPATAREVKPAGLTFLTGAAEGMGFDDAFGSYAEAVLLALIVLLVILAIFLLLALGRSTLTETPAQEAPWPAEAPRSFPATRAGPAGLATTVRATAATTAVSQQTEPEPDVELARPAAPAFAEAAAAAALPTTPSAAAIRIEEVRHEPKEPEAGQRVTTEVLLRNEGPTATLRLTLSVDGKPMAERTVQVPSRATKAVELPWTAGPGDNRVRIQAFPA